MGPRRRRPSALTAECLASGSSPPTTLGMSVFGCSGKSIARRPPPAVEANTKRSRSKESSMWRPDRCSEGEAAIERLTAGGAALVVRGGECLRRRRLLSRLKRRGDGVVDGGQPDTARSIARLLGHVLVVLLV